MRLKLSRTPLKVQAFFVVFLLYRAIQRGNQGAGQNRAHIGAYRVVQTLYYSYTLHTLCACCNQSELTILKICESCERTIALQTPHARP